MNKRFDPDELDPKWTEGELCEYVKKHYHASSGLPSIWGYGFAVWCLGGGLKEMRKARPERLWEPGGRGKNKILGRLVDKAKPVAFSMTPEEEDVFKSAMLARGITNRSDFLREVFQESKAVPADIRSLLEPGYEPDISDTAVAAAVHSQIAGLANQQAPVTNYPGMTFWMYDLALVVARAHMGEILSGTLPMVEDNVRTAGLDPYAENIWGAYMGVLSRFFKTLLRLDRPPTVDVRYKPLEVVDG